MSTPRTCWVISDGRRGIENQALGLAEAMAAQQPLDLSSYYLTSEGFLALLPPFAQRLMGRLPPFPDTLPHMAVGCGRQAISPLLDLKSKGVFTVYVQDPRMDPAQFGAVIAPEHDGLSAPNVLSTVGSPNRITPERLAEDKDLVKPTRNKRAAFLIGGKSKTHGYTPAEVNMHAELIADLLEQDWEIFLTASRRTPVHALKYFSLFDQDFETFHFYDGRGPNPYFAYLHHADMIFVTEDSTNMLTEACTTGKPVFRLPMSGEPGKFAKLYERLEDRCRVRSAIGTDLNPQSYEPLQEADRAAKFVWEKFHKTV